MEISVLTKLRVDESKVVGYLLSHSVGQGKAAFFLGFGFNPDLWEVMADYGVSRLGEME